MAREERWSLSLGHPRKWVTSWGHMSYGPSSGNLGLVPKKLMGLPFSTQTVSTCPDFKPHIPKGPPRWVPPQQPRSGPLCCATLFSAGGLGWVRWGSGHDVGPGTPEGPSSRRSPGPMGDSRLLLTVLWPRPCGHDFPTGVGGAGRPGAQILCWALGSPASGRV